VAGPYNVPAYITSYHADAAGGETVRGKKKEGLDGRTVYRAKMRRLSYSSVCSLGWSGPDTLRKGRDGWRASPRERENNCPS